MAKWDYLNYINDALEAERRYRVREQAEFKKQKKQQAKERQARMIAIPQTRAWDDSIVVLPDMEGNLWIECEMTHPPSSVGKKVTVFFDVATVTKLVPEFRSAGIRARNQGEHG